MVLPELSAERISCSIRWAMTSVSVSVTKTCGLLCCQFTLQFQVVFDDAVMHHHDAPGAIPVGMGIFFGRPAVGCPAGMADAVGAVQRVLPDHFFQVAQLARGAAQLEWVSRAAYRDTGRVVAPVFQPPQAFNDDGDDILGANISHDSTHRILLYGSGCWADAEQSPRTQNPTLWTGGPRSSQRTWATRPEGCSL